MTSPHSDRVSTSLGETRIATRMKIEGDDTHGYETVNTYFYHSDHQGCMCEQQAKRVTSTGSANIITDYEGGIYEHIEYTPYGELWEEQKSDVFDRIPFRFTAKELDDETALYYYGARYIDPRTSRWISIDPAGFDLINPMKEGKPRNNYYVIEAMNWYSYVSNNPVKYVDPNGLIINKPLTLFTNGNVNLSADGYSNLNLSKPKQISMQAIPDNFMLSLAPGSQVLIEIEGIPGGLYLSNSGDTNIECDMSATLEAFIEYKGGLLEKKSKLNSMLGFLKSDYFESVRNIGDIALINILSLVVGTNPAQAAGEAISDIEPEVMNMIDALKAGSEIHAKVNQIDAQLEEIEQ